jgi:hypothetical protein
MSKQKAPAMLSFQDLILKLQQFWAEAILGGARLRHPAAL